MGIRQYTLTLTTSSAPGCDHCDDLEFIFPGILLGEGEMRWSLILYRQTGVCGIPSITGASWRDRNPTERPGTPYLLKYAILLLVLFWSIPTLPQSAYYIFDGHSVSAVQGNPSAASATQWAAFYYKKGASTNSVVDRWGMDFADSPQAIMSKVRQNQKFEKNYEHWCECEWGSDTFSNVLV